MTPIRAESTSTMAAPMNPKTFNSGATPNPCCGHQEVQTRHQWAALVCEQFDMLVYRGRVHLWDSEDDAKDLISAIKIEILEGKFDRALPMATGQAFSFVVGVIRRKAGHICAKQSKAIHIESVMHLLPAGSPCPAAEAESADLRQRIAQAICSLPPRQQELVDLHWVRGMSVSAATRELGIALKTGKEHLRRARHKLRIKLDLDK